MFTPAISPADPNLIMLNCDMSAAYISKDGGHNWRMIHQAQLRTDTQCRPGFHPSDANVIYASSQGRLKISRDRGRSFIPIGNLKESLSGEIAINPSDPDIMLAGTRNGNPLIIHGRFPLKITFGDLLPENCTKGCNFHPPGRRPAA